MESMCHCVVSQLFKHPEKCSEAQATSGTGIHDPYLYALYAPLMFHFSYISDQNLTLIKSVMSTHWWCSHPI